VIKVRV